MKKLLIGFLTVSFFIFLANIKINAEATYGYVKNILDLKNIYISDEPEETGSERCIKSIDPIKLEKGANYTFVLSKYFFRDVSWGDPTLDYEVYLSFKDDDEENLYGFTYSYEYGNDYAYLTFEAKRFNLIIRELPIERSYNPNYNGANIMLYKGEVEDFNGSFTSYKSQMTPINWVFVKDYDDNLATEDIINHISISDSATNEIIVLEDNYTENKNILGEHEIVLMITSVDNNRVFCKLLVKIMDITPPIIQGQTYYEIELMEETLLISDIIKSLRVNDNASIMSEQDIIIFNDEYTRNKDKIGQYTVLFQAIDDVGNIGELEIKINVQDTKPPIIEGPAEIYRYTTDLLITNEEIKNLYNVYDIVDGNLIDYLIIEGTSEATPGSYLYTLSVEDFSGNKTTKILTINIVEGSLPYYTKDNNNILTYQEYEKMTNEDLINWLLKSIEGASEVTILLNEALYLQNKNRPMHLYYSYLLNNQKHYGRILIEPTNDQQTTTLIVLSILGTINIVFGIIYYKRPKIHL